MHDIQLHTDMLSPLAAQGIHFDLALSCHCRTRVLYATAADKAVLEAEYNDACGIRPAWAELVDQAGLVDFGLSETKTAFSITTRQQVMSSVLAIVFMQSFSVNLSSKLRPSQWGKLACNPPGILLLGMTPCATSCW